MNLLGWAKHRRVICLKCVLLILFSNNRRDDGQMDIVHGATVDSIVKNPHDNLKQIFNSHFIYEETKT